MQDNTKAVLQIFAAYAADFNTLDPEKIPPYFHPNAILMTKEIVAFMPDASAVKGVFQKLFKDLIDQDFKSSKINSIQVKQLSENQAVVSGSAARLNSSGEAFETFGLTYTLRQEAGEWKIIFGVLHDTVLLITA